MGIPWTTDPAEEQPKQQGKHAMTPGPGGSAPCRSFRGHAPTWIRPHRLALVVTDTEPDEPMPSLAVIGEHRDASGEPADPPVQGERYRRRLVAPVVLFAIMSVLFLVDFAEDIAKGKTPEHLVSMIAGDVLSFFGLIVMLRMILASRARVQHLEYALDRTREDGVRYREQASQLLQGIGALIDQQFDGWGLSPSEREVGLLLLKGLSLKSIAAARDASEATVRQQAQAVYRKAKLSGRAELAAFFLEDLLLPIPRVPATTGSRR